MSFCYNLIITSFHEQYDSKYCTHTNNSIHLHLLYLMRLDDTQTIDAERRTASTPAGGAKAAAVHCGDNNRLEARQRL
jgi:hypothetical protein